MFALFSFCRNHADLFFLLTPAYEVIRVEGVKSRSCFGAQQCFHPPGFRSIPPANSCASTPQWIWKEKATTIRLQETFNHSRIQMFRTFTIDWICAIHISSMYRGGCAMFLPKAELHRIFRERLLKFFINMASAPVTTQVQT